MKLLLKYQEWILMLGAILIMAVLILATTFVMMKAAASLGQAIGSLPAVGGVSSFDLTGAAAVVHLGQ